MTTQDTELARIVDQFLRVTIRMGELRNAWRSCTVSDCRRGRRCIGAGAPCMFGKPYKSVILPRSDVTEWNDLTAQRRNLARRYSRRAAAIGVTPPA